MCFSLFFLFFPRAKKKLENADTENNFGNVLKESNHQPPKPREPTEEKKQSSLSRAGGSAASKLLGSMKKSKSKSSRKSPEEEKEEDFGDFDLFQPKEDLSQFRPGGSEHRSTARGVARNAAATTTPMGKTPKKRMPTPSKENCKQQ